jgi:hypothetical protein
MRRADGLPARTSSHAAGTTEEGPRMPGFLVRYQNHEKEEQIGTNTIQ